MQLDFLFNVSILCAVIATVCSVITSVKGVRQKLEKSRLMALHKVTDDRK